MSTACAVDCCAPAAPADADDEGKDDDDAASPDNRWCSSRGLMGQMLTYADGRTVLRSPGQGRRTKRASGVPNCSQRSFGAAEWPERWQIRGERTLLLYQEVRLPGFCRVHRSVPTRRVVRFHRSTAASSDAAAAASCTRQSRSPVLFLAAALYAAAAIIVSATCDVDRRMPL